MALIYNATFDKNTRKLSFEDKAGNEIYSFTVPERAPVDDITKPLTFRSTQDSSMVRLRKIGSPSGDFQTSRDGGKTWTDFRMGSYITLNTGDEVSFRAKTNRTSALSGYDYFSFEMTDKIEAWHNVMSLYRTNDFATYNTVMEYAFHCLFKDCIYLTKAPVLPATTTLATDCYSYMFYRCQSLTKAPELPATTLADSCYAYMFYECQSLTKAPRLPATTLAQNCYQGMFYGCSSLNEVRCKIPSTYTSSDMSSKYASNWLYNVSATGTFYTNADANWPSGASGIPTGWTRVNEGAPTVDDITKPLTFRATQDGSTVKLSKIGSPSGTFQTSSDGGNTWTDYTIDTAITLNTDDEVSFRAKVDREFEPSSSDYFQFNMTGKIEAWHNVMSLHRTNDFATYESVWNFAFCALFDRCASLTKAPVLPATTLAVGCYSNMFKGCTSLVNAPKLPATTLDATCYENMFWGCTSLVNAPALPATTLKAGCYESMFYDCTSLKEAPKLPATTLSYGCYQHMFVGCTSLTKAPKLPATTLDENCYQHMFQGCTSLANAPALPATTLAVGCYQHMFEGCTSLTKAPALPATTLAVRCYLSMFGGCSWLNEVHCNMPSSYSSSIIEKTYAYRWLINVSSTGKFYTNADANWPTGESGIPAGWTRVNS